MKKKRFLIIGIIIAILAGTALAVNWVFKKHQSISSTSPDFIVTPVEIIGEFEKDEVSANKKYNDKVVEISGVIVEKTKDQQGKLNITLQGGDLAGIGCVFEPAAQEKANKLKEGEQVTIKGICTGILIDVVVVDCVVVD